MTKENLDNLLPEEIEFIDGATQQLIKKRKFAELPDSVRFLPNSEGDIVPVVKIVEQTDGTQRIIRQYGFNDVLLKSTVQILKS